MNRIHRIGNTKSEVMKMAKKGMKRPDETHTKPRNDTDPVPEIQGKAKHGKERANPVMADTQPPGEKVFDSKPVDLRYDENQGEKPISDAYPAIDNDLARDNLENDISDADLQDLY